MKNYLTAHQIETNIIVSAVVALGEPITAGNLSLLFY